MSKPSPSPEAANQQLWDLLAPVHFKAYREVEMLRRGESVLDPIELSDLGDVTGKSLLHLQCHIGTDTLSWVRRGARVTGADFSTRSLEFARRLQQELGLEADFVHASVYDLPRVLDARFDIVYTSRGVLCWLRDLERWGQIIARYLAPGGVFYLMESHPILNIFEPTQRGPLTIAHPYFHSVEPILYEGESGDYADATFVHDQPSYEWTWSVSDVLNALIGAGLRLDAIHEYDRLFDRRFPDMVECHERWFHFPDLGGKLPLLFTVKAHRPLAD